MTTAEPAGRFAGRTALVTGAGGGTGSATSRRLAGEGAFAYDFELAALVPCGRIGKPEEVAALAVA